MNGHLNVKNVYDLLIAEVQEGMEEIFYVM